MTEHHPQEVETVPVNPCVQNNITVNRLETPAQTTISQIMAHQASNYPWPMYIDLHCLYFVSKYEI